MAGNGKGKEQAMIRELNKFEFEKVAGGTDSIDDPSDDDRSDDDTSNSDPFGKDPFSGGGNG